jgi:1-acyl-sn-glycerol-3-phosphate acyltransferase
MIFLRSLLFNAIFFLVFGLLLLLGQPLLLPYFDERAVYRFWYWASKIVDLMARKIAGISYSIENAENILNTPAIYAMRHESTWETLVLINIFQKPVFVLKKELWDVPLFGGLSKKSNAIAVDRDNGVHALISAVKNVQEAIANEHPVIIFPEGTRIATGEHVEIKRGIWLFYKKANCPVVPVVHDSGKCWPRRGFLKKPGMVTLKFLDAIAPGLSQDEFMDKLNKVFYEEVENLKSKGGNLMKNNGKLMKNNHKTTLAL